MPPVTLSRQYATLLSLTFDNYKPTLVDNIHKGIPYLWWMENRAKGVGVRMESGGTRIRVPVVYSTNANAKSFYGYDLLTASPTEEITSTFEPWKSNATVVALSWDEILENGGPEGLIGILPSKMKVAEMSMRQEINRQLVQGIVGGAGSPTFARFIAGNGTPGKDLLPLGYLIQKNMTLNADLIHSVDQNANSWWRPGGTSTGGQVLASTAANYADLKKEMNHKYNDCAKGGTNDAPDLILCDQNYYEVYEGSLMMLQRYDNYLDEDAASAGFGGLRFKGATLLWDEYVPDFGATTTDTVALAQTASRAVAFFLNSNWIELVVHRLGYFETTPFQEPNDQTAIYAKVLLKAGHIITQRRKHSVHYNVNSAIAT
jgi:hypothetical protein